MHRLRPRCSITPSLVWALTLWLALVGIASAQSTGGSFGGSSWGSSSGSSGGSSSSSWSGSSSSSYGSSAGTSGHSYEPPVPVQMLIAVTFLAFLYWLLLWRGGLLGRLAARAARIDVSMLQLSLDARARRFVQGTLTELAKSGDARTPEGRARLLGATARALSSARLAWIHAAVRNFDPMPPERAQAEHQRLVSEARAGFQHELVRNEGGRTTTEVAPALTPREHEGDGVVLVTLVVASRRTLRNPSASDQAALAALLSTLAELKPAELVALDVVWTPAADEDRMSTDELEARYPGLTRLGAPAGRVFCAHCGGPHAAELTICPHCGAPRSA